MIKKFFASLVLIFGFSAISAQSGEGMTVVVQKGDQLGVIAQRYIKEPANSYWDEIAKFNNLKLPFTIYPGMRLRLPMHLLASQTAAAKWTAVTGDVRIYPKNGAEYKASVGGSFGEGERALLAQNASAVLMLPDSSHIKLLGGSEFVLEESRYYVGRARADAQDSLNGTKAFSGLMRLIQGAVEVKATSAADRAQLLRIQTPTAVVGVRGTDFRVSYADATRSEVTDGLVLAQLDAARKTDVAGGFGVKLNPADKEIPAVVALLNAPDLSGWVAKQENRLVEFAALPTKQENKTVTAYRVQLASDPEMTKVSFNQLFASGASVQVSNLAQGTWYATVRAVDEHGLEGKNASFKFDFHTRIEPPKVQMQVPQLNQKFLSKQEIAVGWLQARTATDYVVQFQPAGGSIAEQVTQNLSVNLNQLPPGQYSWRIASKINTDQGPWSDWSAFTVLAKPGALTGELGKSGYELKLTWPDIGAKSYEVQFSGEPNFETTHENGNITHKTGTRPELMIYNLQATKNYVRYRAIHADGFVGEWSDTLEIDAPKSKISLWLMLGWLAIFL